MGSAAQFVAQFFPIFLLGALFGKQMDDSGSVQSIAKFMSEKLGHQRAILAVVLAGALVTYGGVSLFVAFFVLAPMARALFQAANIPQRLMPAAIALGTSTFTMSAMPGTPAIQNTIPMPFFGTTPFAAPGLGSLHRRSCWHSGCGGSVAPNLPARRSGEGFGGEVNVVPTQVADDQFIRERATAAHEFDPAEIAHGSMPTRHHRSAWQLFRFWWSLRSTCCCQSSSCRVSISHSWPRSVGAARRLPPSQEYGR